MTGSVIHASISADAEDVNNFRPIKNEQLLRVNFCFLKSGLFHEKDGAEEKLG